jgi:outer membrane PBP1 activator LpoA protein
MTRSLTLLGCGFLAILTVCGCEVTSTHRGTSTSTGSTNAQEQPRRGGRSATDPRIVAAESYRSAGERTRASSTLDGIDPARLDAANQFAYYDLRALLAIDARDYAQARQAIALAIPASAIDRNALASTTADLAEGEQRFEDAAAALMTYSFTVRGADDSQFASIVDRTWSDVNRTPAYRVTALATAPDQGGTAAAWWQLADALQRSFDLEAERAAIVEWRRTHRDHPASRWPPRALTVIEDGAFSPPTHLALLLPLSGPLANAGQAVRDGFVAAFYHAGSKGLVRVYDTNGAPVAGLYEQAVNDGAQLVVGPLDKQSVVDINLLPVRRVPVLAVNYLPNGVAASAGLFQFGLAIEDDARAIARRVYGDGLARVVVVESDLDWSNRALDSFKTQFVELGGTVVTVGTIRDARAVTEIVGSALLVAASNERMEALSKTIGTKPEFTARRRSDVDALIALTNAAQSRALNPAMAFHFASDVPIYATSQSAGTSMSDLDDLNGIRMTALPWQIYPSPVRDEVNTAFGASQSPLSSLYALGVDAFRLSNRADLLLPNAAGRLLGETGQLQMQAPGIIVRDPAWAIVQRGTLVAMPTVAP